MRRNILLLVAFLVLIGGAQVSSVRAQLPPDYLTHYKLLPRLSTLHQTGGIAGVDWWYRLMGSYDLQRSVGWTGTASFENAEIWGSIISPIPTPAVVLDVDQLLNLEGLKGEALPVAAPFDVYQFTGTTSDGSTVRLLASLIGPWMYLRGGTEPAGGADYFRYDIRALARSRPFADLNEDGAVDAADYVLLRKGPVAAATGDSVALADWIEQYGEQLPDLAVYDAMINAAVGGLGTATVPEPGFAVLLWAGCIAIAIRRRRPLC